MLFRSCDSRVVLGDDRILLGDILIVLVDGSVGIGYSIIVRDPYRCPCDVVDDVRCEDCSERRSADHVISAVWTIPYIIVAVVCDAVVSVESCSCRKHSHSVAEIVVMSRPVA